MPHPHRYLPIPTIFPALNISIKKKHRQTDYHNVIIILLKKIHAANSLGPIFVVHSFLELHEHLALRITSRPTHLSLKEFIKPLPLHIKELIYQNILITILNHTLAQSKIKKALSLVAKKRGVKSIHDLHEISLLNKMPAYFQNNTALRALIIIQLLFHTLPVAFIVISNYSVLHIALNIIESTKPSQKNAPIMHFSLYFLCLIVLCNSAAFSLMKQKKIDALILLYKTTDSINTLKTPLSTLFDQAMLHRHTVSSELANDISALTSPSP